MELKKYTFKENLIFFMIGFYLGIILICNVVIIEYLINYEEPIVIPKVESIYIETPQPIVEIDILQKETSYDIVEEDISEEIKYGEMELVAQLVQAEAGNQDLMGKRMVVDVVLNRVDDPRFPNTVEEVIFQKDPVQFVVTSNGAFDEAGWYIDEETYKAVEMEYEKRTNTGIIYFATTPCNGTDHFKVGDHWFSY